MADRDNRYSRRKRKTYLGDVLLDGAFEDDVLNLGGNVDGVGGTGSALAVYPPQISISGRVGLVRASSSSDRSHIANHQDDRSKYVREKRTRNPSTPSSIDEHTCESRNL